MTPDSFDLALTPCPWGRPVRLPPMPAQTDPLGGWIRGFDTVHLRTSSSPAPRAPAGATCQDTSSRCTPTACSTPPGGACWTTPESAVWTAQGWVGPRPPDGDVEDGYLFAYGHDYTGALRTFAHLTGPAPLLPRNVFGVWYSDYTPYSSTTSKTRCIPPSSQDHVPLNTLSLDTDWKAPNNWDGWEWNSQLFPHPGDVPADGPSSKGIDVTLNVHSSIAVDDPKAADRAAHRRTTAAPRRAVTAGLCKIWDWSSDLAGRVQLRTATELSEARGGVLVAGLVL